MLYVKEWNRVFCDDGIKEVKIFCDSGITLLRIIMIYIGIKDKMRLILFDLHFIY